jgi:hypothetical protein
MKTITIRKIIVLNFLFDYGQSKYSPNFNIIRESKKKNELPTPVQRGKEDLLNYEAPAIMSVPWVQNP